MSGMSPVQYVRYVPGPYRCTPLPPSYIFKLCRLFLTCLESILFDKRTALNFPHCEMLLLKIAGICRLCRTPDSPISASRWGSHLITQSSPSHAPRLATSARDARPAHSPPSSAQSARRPAVWRANPPAPPRIPWPALPGKPLPAR